MTGEDIQQKVNRYIDREPSIDLVIDGIQEAINWLGNMNYILDTISIEAEADEVYELPPEFIRIIKVEIPDENEYYYNYLIDGDTIRFADDNEYRIYAQKHPFQYEDKTEDLKLHPMLTGCVLTYCKGFCKLAVDDTSQDGHKLTEKFREDATKAYETLKRGQKSPSKVRVSRHAR